MSTQGVRTRRRTDVKRSEPVRKVKKAKLKKNKMDLGFLAVVITLLVIGLLMVFSASYPYAYYVKKDAFFFIKDQLVWAALGFAAMMCTANFPYWAYKKHIKLIFGVSAVLLLLVLTPMGKEINGAQRWLALGGFSFQPSELVKFGIIVCVAYLIEKDGAKLKKFNSLIKYGLFLGLFFVLLILQPHFSVCIIICLTVAIMLLVGGTKIKHFIVVGIPAAAIGVVLVIMEPYRLARIMNTWTPFKDAKGAGWQIIQSLYAIGSGGFFGLGFGNSRQKYLYVPEPHNDFIFAIACEELGFIGAVVIIIIFALLIIRGMKIAMNAPDTFASMLVTGIMSLVGIQVVLNIAVVTSTVPTTGIPLPFFSYGGTALLCLMAAMGIVLNVSRYSKENKLN